MTHSARAFAKRKPVWGTMSSAEPFDAIIIGGGPAGATAGIALARMGRRALILEKAAFPRFHVGESFLPRSLVLLKQLGLLKRLEKLPRVRKFGAEFGFGHGRETSCFTFDHALFDDGHESFNIERAAFDNMLLESARDAGAIVRSSTAVKRIHRLSENDVVIEAGGETITGRCLIDASGQATFLARHLGLRRRIPNHNKIAYFGHFENAERLPGNAEGHPTVAMCSEGWFWMINIDERRTSVGMVLDANVARSLDIPACDMLFWGIDRCPLVGGRLKRATFPHSTHTISDFSYYCRPFAGPGYFLIGDAAFFLDPVFSSGLCFGMDAALHVADSVDELLAGAENQTTRNRTTPRSPEAIRRAYLRFMNDTTTPFLRLVNLFYDHSFRELFQHGQGPMQVQRAAISILAGHVFPKPRWSLRWRIRLLAQMVRIQRVFPLVARREPFSLLADAAVGSEPVERSCVGA